MINKAAAHGVTWAKLKIGVMVAQEEMMKTNENGFLICPRCGKKTNTKVLVSTVLKDFPLHCKNCKKVTVINHN